MRFPKTNVLTAFALVLVAAWSVSGTLSQPAAEPLALAEHRHGDGERIAVARAKATAILHLAGLAQVERGADADDPAEPSPCIESYETGRARALAENKYLVVWVGGCEGLHQVRDAFPRDVLHCHAASWNGRRHRRIIFPTPTGARSYTAEELRPEAVPQIYSYMSGEHAPDAPYPAQTFAPQGRAAPAALTFGGFGGGGCANGQCGGGGGGGMFRRR
jgi:hypothetical protein